MMVHILTTGHDFIFKLNAVVYEFVQINYFQSSLIPKCHRLWLLPIFDDKHNWSLFRIIGVCWYNISWNQMAGANSFL